MFHYLLIVVSYHDMREKRALRLTTLALLTDSPEGYPGILVVDYFHYFRSLTPKYSRNRQMPRENGTVLDRLGGGSATMSPKSFL